MNIGEILAFNANDNPAGEALVFEGRLEPVIQEVLPLDEARRAHELLEAGEVFGKLVLVP